MNRKLRCLSLGILLCSGCTSNVKGDAFDEFGVPYYKDALLQDNVFAFRYYIGDQKEDTFWNRTNRPIDLQIKLPITKVDTSVNPIIRIPFSVAIDPERYSDLDISSLTPVLYYNFESYFKSDIADEEKPMAVLPSFIEADYGTWKIDFPSKGYYYVGYQFSSEFYFDYSVFAKVHSKTYLDFLFRRSIRLYDKGTGRYVAYHGRNDDGEFTSLDWSYTTSIFAEKEDEKTLQLLSIRRNL